MTVGWEFFDNAWYKIEVETLVLQKDELKTAGFHSTLKKDCLLLFFIFCDSNKMKWVLEKKERKLKVDEQNWCQEVSFSLCNFPQRHTNRLT